MNNIPLDIVTRASGGDMDAFHELYKLSSGYVYNIALKVTSNREDAEEVAQDVFVKIYNNLKDFRFRSNVNTWIYRITINTAINKYKKRTKENSGKSLYNEAVLPEPAQQSLKKRIEDEENKLVVRKLLELLNPDQRACVTLRDIEGLSYKEIAGVLRININTVRSRLKRARNIFLKAAQKGVV